MAAAATTASAPAMTSASAATTAAFARWPSLIDDHGPTLEVPAVQLSDCFFRFAVVGDLRKSEAARLAGKTVAHQCQALRLHARFSKQFLQLLFGSLEWQVPQIEFLQEASPSALEAAHAAGS
jgi:hypothetical protein